MRISSKQYLQATSQLTTDGESSQTEIFAKIGAKKCFRDTDTNKDGVITQDEVTLSKEAFAKLDASQDGKVTQEEMSAALAGHGQEIYSYFAAKKRTAKSQELLATILGDTSTQTQTTAAEKAAKKYITNKDTNKDGTLSRDEVKFSASTFNKIDTNSNGRIEQTELQTVLKSHDAKLAAYFKASEENTSTALLTSNV